MDYEGRKRGGERKSLIRVLERTGYGSRFKNICENTELFTKTIAEGIKNADEREAEQERIAKTVRGQLMRHPECSFDIMTADGRVQLTPEDIRALFD